MDVNEFYFLPSFLSRRLNTRSVFFDSIRRVCVCVCACDQNESFYVSHPSNRRKETDDSVDLVVQLTGGISKAVVIVSLIDLLNSIAVETQFFVGISSPGDGQVSD
jgi:hypothetical protein